MLNNKKIENKLKDYNQEHIIEEIEKMDAEQQEAIIKQISQIDFEQITNLYQNTKIKKDKIKSEITPIDYIDKNKIEREEKKQLQLIGEQIIRNNQYAVVTMAGRTRNKVGI